MRGRSRPPAWYEATLERRGRSAHLEDLARWSRPLRGMAVECLDVQLVLEFLGADGVLGRVKWMHFTLGNGTSPHSKRSRPRTDPNRTPLPRGRSHGGGHFHGPGSAWGCPPLAHSASWVDGDRHHGQGVDNPPTVVPRADDAPTTDSPVNETQPQVGSRRRRRVGLRCRLSHHPRGRTGFKRNIAPLKREAALGMRCRRYCPPTEHRPFDRVGPKLSNSTNYDRPATGRASRYPLLRGITGTSSVRRCTAEYRAPRPLGRARPIGNSDFRPLAAGGSHQDTAPGRRDHNRSALAGKPQSPDSPATSCERSSAQLPPSISTSKRNCVSFPVSDIDAGVPPFTVSVGSASTTHELSALLAR